MKEKLILRQLSHRIHINEHKHPTAIYEEIVQILDDYKVRIHIVSSDYSYERKAEAFLWVDNQWRKVHALLPNQMKTITNVDTLSVSREEGTFREDRRELLDAVKKILDLGIDT
jgi:hypothetical protein